MSEFENPKLPKPLPGAKSQKAPTDPPANLAAPADPAKADPEGAPPISHSVPVTERICGYPQCNKVMPTDQPCDKHEQICPNCGMINIRGTQACIKCKFHLPTLPIVLEVAAPAAPSSQELVSGSITLPPTTPTGLSPDEEIIYGAAEKTEDEAKAAEVKPVLMADPPPPPPADTVKVPPLAPPRLTRVEEHEAEAPPRLDELDAGEDEPPPVTPLPEAGPKKIESNGMAKFLLLIILMTLAAWMGFKVGKDVTSLEFEREALEFEREALDKKIRETEKIIAKVEAQQRHLLLTWGPQQTKKITSEVKTTPTTPPPMTPPVTTPMHPAPEKEITFRAEEVGHVWTGRTEQFLDKDDD